MSEGDGHVGHLPQQSKSSPALQEKDPYNKLYARGPRVRLSAEEIRDQALAVSGLLYDSLYGPPVMPWQPAGIWHSPYSSEQWSKSPGRNQYALSIDDHFRRRVEGGLYGEEDPDQYAASGAGAAE